MTVLGNGWHVVPVERGDIRWKPEEWGVRVVETVYSELTSTGESRVSEIRLPWRTMAQIQMTRERASYRD